MTQPTGPHAFLNDEPGPRMLVEALKLFGTLEAAGPANNSTILAWADEIAPGLGTSYAVWAAGWYSQDSVAWCGLFMAVVAQRANPDNRPERRPPEKFLSAAEWAKWGTGVNMANASLGDVLVFKRDGGGHVGLYVGDDAEAFHVLGGNQSDKVCITRIAKARCAAVRRPLYLAKPANVRPIRMGVAGPLSKNEA